MRGKLKFLLLYLLSWVFFFEIARLIFICRNIDKISQLPVRDVLLSFVYGLRMDVSMASYILIPICFFTILGIFLPFFKKTILYKVYTGVILLLSLLLVIVDLEVFRQWGFRMDASPLKYLNTPNEAWASVSHLPVFWYTLGFIIIYLISYKLFSLIIAYINKFQQKDFQTTGKKVGGLFLLILFTVLLIIPIRGGFQLAPINQSSVYFSTNNLANQSAINVPWNFLRGLMKKSYSTHNPYNYMELGKAKQLLDSLYASSGKYEEVLRVKRPNLILIAWESFTEKVIHRKVEGIEVTPRFNQLKQEGLYFSNIYASGDRSNKGLPAIFSGYPALPAGSIISIPTKSDKLATISGVLKLLGYKTSFYYGGEPEFANIKSYLVHGGYDPIITIDNFTKKDQNSKWGAHDAVVMKRIVHDLADMKQPFFTGWFTLSSHEPFETNEPPVFKGEERAIKFLNTHHYTDECIYQLVQYCKQQPWWENTLIIITADHGHPLPETANKEDNFRIPLLWIGGALNKKGVVDKYASQLDIAHTLTHLMNIPDNYFPFSRNIFDSTAAPWAFFTFNNGFGFMQPGKKLVYDNVGKMIIEQEGVINKRDIEAGQALQQWTYQDYLNK